MEITDDELNQTLRRLAHPATPLTPAVEDELAALTISTLRAIRPARKSSVRRVAWISGVSAAAMLGIGASAVAAGVGLWVPWAESPDGSFTYTLPSGITCEERVGNLHAENPDVQRAVQEIFSSTDVVDTANIDEWNARLQAQDGVDEYAQATIDAGELPNITSTSDVIYGMAVSRAVMEVVDAELAERGFDLSDEQNLITVHGQAVCGQDTR